MEWREIKRADQKKTIGLWVHNEEHWKQQGITHVETYYCPLRNRCGCRAQLRITRAPSVAVLEWSGGPLTYKLCHSEDASKTLTVRQRVAVAKEFTSASREREHPCRFACKGTLRQNRSVPQLRRQDFSRNFADKISAGNIDISC